MRSLKKIVAAFAAATMIMSIGSVAFADVQGEISVGANHDTVSLDNYDDIVDSTSQWTVIIIDKANQNKDALEASDLYYINQGTSEDPSGFWTNMGTKSVLTEGTPYLMRIGSNTNIDTAEGYYEFEFSYTETPQGPTYMLGDAYVDSAIDLADVSAVLGHILGTQIISDEAALLGADAYVDNTIDLADVSAILGHILGTQLLVQD